MMYRILNEKKNYFIKFRLHVFYSLESNKRKKKKKTKPDSTRGELFVCLNVFLSDETGCNIIVEKNFKHFFFYFIKRFLINDWRRRFAL